MQAGLLMLDAFRTAAGPMLARLSNQSKLQSQCLLQQVSKAVLAALDYKSVEGFVDELCYSRQP